MSEPAFAARLYNNNLHVAHYYYSQEEDTISMPMYRHDLSEPYPQTHLGFVRKRENSIKTYIPIGPFVRYALSRIHEGLIGVFFIDYDNLYLLGPFYGNNNTMWDVMDKVITQYGVEPYGKSFTQKISIEEIYRHA